MDISHYSTVFPFWCLEGSSNLIFYMTFESSYEQKWYNMENEGHVDAIRSPFNHPYTYKEGYEIL